MLRGFLLLCLVGWMRIAGATPQVLRVDGSVFDASGAAYTGAKDFRVKAYDASSAGTLLWTSSVVTSSAADGRFSLQLDASVGSPSLVERMAERASTDAMWFVVEIDSGATNGAMDSAIAVAPRFRAKGSAFALAAAKADAISGVTATAVEMNYLAGVTANLQSQIAAISPSASLLRAGAIAASARALPTSGSISGTYLHLGNVTSTGAYTAAAGTRIYLKGNLVLGHNLTVTGVTIGGQSLVVSYTNGQPGGGFSGGGVPEGYTTGGGGGGGAFGGAGGHGGGYMDAAYGWGGRAYSWETVFAGSGGGAPPGYSTSDNPGDGGDAGGTLYLEVTGNVTIGGSSTISANGGAGLAGTGGSYVPGGGGGSGGGVMIRAGGTITIASGSSITAHGGAGGTGLVYAGGGGGGGGGVIALWAGGAITISGTISANGGTRGTDGGSQSVASTAGLVGVTQAISSVTPISFY